MTNNALRDPLKEPEHRFDQLLRWLDPDTDRAIEKHELIRRGLLKFFSLRKCEDPKPLVDRTIEVVSRKVPVIQDRFKGDPSRYFHGVARSVYRDHLKGGGKSGSDTEGNRTSKEMCEWILNYCQKRDAESSSGKPGQQTLLDRLMNILKSIFRRGKK